MENNNDPLASDHYYKLGDAWTDLKYSSGPTETAKSSVKLIGKTVFNTALFAGLAAAEVVKRMPEAIEREKSRQGGKK